MPVYVIQEVPGRNVLSAGAFGSLVVLLPSLMQLQVSTDEARGIMEKKLEGFGKKDYLLLIGDPVAIGMATAIAARNNHGQVNFLKWDRLDRRYYKITMQI